MTMLVSGGTETRDLTAELQEATKEFAGLYERHAYLVYNLALRIMCERAGAMSVTERTFLEHAHQPEDVDALAQSVVTTALAEARPRPRASGAGSAAEEAMLALTARALDARERAALATSALAGELADPALLDGAYGKLAAARGEGVEEARDAYAAWLWAAPPPPLWQALYPKFYRAAERALSEPVADDAALTQKLPAPPRERGRRGFSSWKFALLLLVPMLLTAGAVAWPHLRSGGGKPAHQLTFAEAQARQAATPVASPGSSSALQADAQTSTTPDNAVLTTAPNAKKKKPLTPKQLDQLRQNELRALELYSKREEDRRLTQAQRDYAAQKIALLRDLAQQRLDAVRQQRAAARAQRRAAHRERQLQREQRQAASHQQNQTLTVVTNDGSSNDTTTQPKKQSSGSAPQNSQDAQQQCLYDANNGTYICQQ